ncbi:MAG: anti-sigma factor [Chloroflexi bacterium]|nr:MAG: anti-sigma factor [Chloroflexota bacterium]
MFLLPLPYRTLAYVPRGPILDPADHELGHAVLQALHRQARRHRAIALKVEPPWFDSAENAAWWVGEGFQRGMPGIQPTRTHVIDLLREPGTSVLRLRGQAPAADASASLLWNDQSGGHLLVAGLAPLPADKAYELWTISAGTPRPAGVFAVDASGRGGHFVDPVPGGRPEAFTVTIEPAKGVPSPTGPIVLMGGGAP